ncbi:MAG: hypothetical protein B7C24_08030 [Bacteroidetes bacterium 4572_77]|nr:MAG: hypothetical protein B7C24_08030 [Bacteroidetes bacterium 4572_77]
MTKEQLDIEKMFKQNFEDFSPETSNKFNTKMAKRIGLASFFGFAFTSGLGKLGALKTLALEAVGIIKTAGIIKSIAVVTVISTTIATPVIIKTVEKANKKKIAENIIREKREADFISMPLLEMKTSHLNLTDLKTKYTKTNFDLLVHHERHNKLVPIFTYSKEDIQLAGFASKEGSILVNSGRNPKDISKHKTTPSTKNNASDKTEIIAEENANPTSKVNHFANKSASKNNPPQPQSTTLLATNLGTTNDENEAIYPLKTIDFNSLKIDKNPISIVPKDKLQLKVDVLEKPSEKPIFSDVIAFGEVYFLPFSYHNTNSIKPLSNDTIVNQFMEESPQLSYQFGFDIRLQKKQKPYFVNLGINYQKISEQIDYYFKKKTIGYWDYDSTIYQVINPPYIDTIYSVDSAYILQWQGETNSRIHSNSYHYINIPIQFGYEFFKKKKFNLQVSTGIEMAIRLNSTGYLFNEYGHIINYADIKTSPTIDWYYLAGIGLTYEMNKTSMFLLPSIKYQLNTSRTNNSPREHKYFIYGLKIGIRFKLF